MGYSECANVVHDVCWRSGVVSKDVWSETCKVVSLVPSRHPILAVHQYGVQLSPIQSYSIPFTLVPCQMDPQHYIIFGLGLYNVK